jgi:hypothetical protein
MEMDHHHVFCGNPSHGVWIKYRHHPGFNRLPGMVLLPAKERKSSCDQELGTPVGKSLDGQRNSIKGSGTVTKTCHGPASFLPG